MSAGVVCAPGTKFGPCAEACAHLDCKASREEAASICYRCDREIGYETRFYAAERGYVHAACEEAAVDERRRS